MKFFAGAFKIFFRIFDVFLAFFRDFDQKSVFVPLFTVTYKLIEMPYSHDIFSRTNNNVKEMFEKLWKKILLKKIFFETFEKKIFIDFELFSIFTQMTIEISDPISIFKGSNRLNIVPKLPKMFFLIQLNVFRRQNMLAMVGDLIEIAYSASNAKNMKKPLKSHR